jgi:uncharacterized protein (DUF1778 family)
MSAATALAVKEEREARIPARMPQVVYEKITEAAALLGSTLNQFLVSAALDKANAILEQERVLNLHFQSAKIVLDLISNPPEPNDALKRAMLKRRESLANPDTGDQP